MESNEGECARAMWTPLFFQRTRSPQRSARSIDHPSQAVRSPFVSLCRCRASPGRKGHRAGREGRRIMASIPPYASEDRSNRCFDEYLCWPFAGALVGWGWLAWCRRFLCVDTVKRGCNILSLSLARPSCVANIKVCTSGLRLVLAESYLHSHQTPSLLPFFVQRAGYR